MFLPFWKINDDKAGFLSLAQTLKASKECQKECADDCTALLESLEVCKHFGLNLALTQRAYLNTFGRVWLFSLFFLSGGANDYVICSLIENGSDVQKKKMVRKSRFWMHLLNWLLCRDCRKLARQISFWCMMFQKMHIKDGLHTEGSFCTEPKCGRQADACTGRWKDFWIEIVRLLSRSFNAWLQFSIILDRHWARRICCLCKCWWTESGSTFPDEMRFLDGWADERSKGKPDAVYFSS